MDAYIKIIFLILVIGSYMMIILLLYDPKKKNSKKRDYSEINDDLKSKSFYTQNKNEDDFLQETYPFLDDFYITVYVNKKNKKQKIKIAYWAENKEVYSTFIDCVHVAVTDTNICKIKSKSVEKTIIHAFSSENLKKIDLTAEEKFMALCSWAESFCLYGMDGLNLLKDIENMAGFGTPISLPIIMFAMTLKDDLFDDLMEQIDIECFYEGKRHESSFIASIENVLNIIKSRFVTDMDVEKRERMIDKILDLDPPKEVVDKCNLIKGNLKLKYTMSELL